MRDSVDTHCLSTKHFNQNRGTDKKNWKNWKIAAFREKRIVGISKDQQKSDSQPLHSPQKHAFFGKDPFSLLSFTLKDLRDFKQNKISRIAL